MIISLIELLSHVIEIKANGQRIGLPTSSSEKSLKDEYPKPKPLEQQIQQQQQQAAQQQQPPPIQLVQQQKSEDINVLDIVDGQLENMSLTSSERQRKVAEKWNRKTLCLIRNQKVVIDRITWITKNGKPIKYTSDTMGYPMYIKRINILINE